MANKELTELDRDDLEGVIDGLVSALNLLCEVVGPDAFVELLSTRGYVRSDLKVSA